MHVVDVTEDTTNLHAISAPVTCIT